jgi:unspecific monooxygenase
VHALGNAVHVLLREGIDMAALIHDDAAMAKVVEESLRFAPPLHLFKRYALEPLDFYGVELKQGDQVALILGATGRDARVVAQPDALLPSRPTAPHTSFGAGIHFCVGAPLARLELQLALKVLFTRCPTLRLAADPAVKDSWHFHGLEQLLVHC